MAQGASTAFRMIAVGLPRELAERLSAHCLAFDESLDDVVLDAIELHLDEAERDAAMNAELLGEEPSGEATAPEVAREPAEVLP